MFVSLLCTCVSFCVSSFFSSFSASSFGVLLFPSRSISSPLGPSPLLFSPLFTPSLLLSSFLLPLLSFLLSFSPQSITLFSALNFSIPTVHLFIFLLCYWLY